jgi:hypothetical protein
MTLDDVEEAVKAGVAARNEQSALIERKRKELEDLQNPANKK